MIFSKSLWANSPTYLCFIVKFQSKKLNRKNEPFSSAWWTQSSQVAVLALTEARTNAPNFILSQFSQKMTKFGFFQKFVSFYCFCETETSVSHIEMHQAGSSARWLVEAVARAPKNSARWSQPFQHGLILSEKQKEEFFFFEFFPFFSKRIISDCGAKLAYRYRRNHGFWWWGELLRFENIEK